MANLKDLLRANLIIGGTEVFWKRTKVKHTFIATINSNGTITTDDGVTHKTPSGAAKHLNGNKPVDGWTKWKVRSTGERLSELRKKLP